MLDGVQARRANASSDFVIGLSNRMFIPVLTHPLAEIVERWPWDVIIDAEAPFKCRREPIKSRAELTIALGPGPIAGTDSDLVIASRPLVQTPAPSFGAAPRAPLHATSVKRVLDDAHPAVAPETGIFTTGRRIGEAVAAQEPLGLIGSTTVVSPAAGRIWGLQRTGRAVAAEAVVAEIATKATTQTSGSSKTDQLIARGVIFAIEMEFAGSTPVSLDRFL